MIINEPKIDLIGGRTMRSAWILTTLLAWPGAAAPTAAAAVVDVPSRLLASSIFSSLDRPMAMPVPLQRLQSWSSGLGSGPDGPPVGAVYSAVLKMPLIGRQTFILRILRRKRIAVETDGIERGLAQITLIGAMNLDEPAEFTVGGDGQIELDFNAATVALLRRMRTRIRSCTYYMQEDYTVLVVAPPLVPAIHVRLLREELPEDVQF